MVSFITKVLEVGKGQIQQEKKLKDVFMTVIYRMPNALTRKLV
jgi:hypothetical protein